MVLGEKILNRFAKKLVKMVDVNNMLRFFEGYETLLVFDNQESVFLFRDIWSLQTWSMLQKTLLRTLKYPEKKLSVQPALLDVRMYQRTRFVALWRCTVKKEFFFTCNGCLTHLICKNFHNPMLFYFKPCFGPNILFHLLLLKIQCFYC